MSKSFTKAEVATHKDEANGIYIIIDNGVYDITSMCPPKILHKCCSRVHALT